MGVVFELRQVAFDSEPAQDSLALTYFSLFVQTVNGHRSLG